MRTLFVAFLALVALQSCSETTISTTHPGWEGKPRVVVMTDGEIDDRCSMVHFLLYTNQLQVDAIIQSNSCFQRKGWSSEPWIEEQLAAYEQVLPNLRVHDPAYPSADELRRVVYVGDEDPTHIPEGISYKTLLPGEEPFIDPSEWADTPGSDRIVEILLEEDSRPVYIQCWGGGNTAVRAFDKLKQEHPADYDRAIRKAVLYCIWYQDGAGSYIERVHPQATILLSHHFSGSWDYGSLPNSDHFVNEHLRNKANPLGKFYEQPFISEGDTPAFLYALPNGLRSYENPTYGGWGGRFYKVEGFEKVYRDVSLGSLREWVETALCEFQARLKWCVTPNYEEANHAPVIEVEGALDRVVRSGEEVVLRAKISDKDPRDIEGAWRVRGHMWQQKGRTRAWLEEDPEKRLEEYRTDWCQDPAGSYSGSVDLQFLGKEAVSFVAPEVDQPETIHVILEAFDMAVPRLTSYARYIVTVVPN
ncbi:MAG: DUF1593 domain-containing protein [Alistipes sp.]|nr:DUF1593 domain-containing protein [Alistipes sp.]